MSEISNFYSTSEKAGFMHILYKVGHSAVTDMEHYEKVMRKAFEAKSVMDGYHDLKDGKTVDGDSVIENIRSRYGV